MKAIVFLATGFDEIEAIGTIEMLRRGDIDTLTVSVTGEKTVTGSRGIPVIADELFENVDYTPFEGLILPGGAQGSIMLNNHAGVCKTIVEFHESQKLIAAICAAPRVFGRLGLLNGKKATCYPGIEPELTGAIIVDEAAVTDRNIITGKGPGLVFDFGLALLDYLDSPYVANNVAEDLLL